jgi:NitT/TauT family transport system substrate-binding protein
MKAGWRWGAVGAVAIVLTVSACGSSGSSGSANSGTSSSSANLGTIRLVYGAPPASSSSAAPFAVALQMGYWKKLGLNVNILGLAGGPAAVQALLTGRGDISVSGASELLTSISTGKPLPLLEFYNWIVRNTYAISVPQSSAVQSIAELKGKPIGVENLGKDDAIALTTILSIAEGVSKSAIQLVPVGSGTQALQALKSGQVAAYAGGDTQNSELNALGYPIRNLALPPSLDQATDTVWVTTPSYFAGHKAQLAAFGEGLSEAEVFCKTNIDACIKLYWKQYPTAAPSDASSDFASAAKVIAASMTARLPKLAPVDGKWGYQPVAGYQSLATVLDIKQVDPAQIQKLFTNALTDQFSDFNESTIKSEAQNFAAG